MSEEYRWVVDKIADPSLRGAGDILAYAALCNALSAAAPDQESWARGAEAFVACLEGSQSLDQAFFEALNAAAPDGGSWEAGIYKVNDLANSMTYLASLTNNWSRNPSHSSQASDPNDPYQKFLAQVQTTLKGLEQQGKKPHLINDAEGNSVTGWIFERGRDRRLDKELNYFNSTTGGYLETWGQDDTILTVGGEFYLHNKYSSEEKRSSGSNLEEQKTDRLQKLPISWLTGNRGEPFSEIITKLKRFPYTAYSLA